MESTALITPASTAEDEIELESIDSDTLYCLLIQNKIPQIVAQRFKSKFLNFVSFFFI